MNTDIILPGIAGVTTAIMTFACDALTLYMFSPNRLERTFPSAPIHVRDALWLGTPTDIGSVLGFGDS